MIKIEFIIIFAIPFFVSGCSTSKIMSDENENVDFAYIFWSGSTGQPRRSFLITADDLGEKQRKEIGKIVGTSPLTEIFEVDREKFLNFVEEVFQLEATDFKMLEGYVVQLGSEIDPALRFVKCSDKVETIDSAQAAILIATRDE